MPIRFNISDDWELQRVEWWQIQRKIRSARQKSVLFHSLKAPHCQ